MEARNTKCGPYIHENDLTYSDTLTGGFTTSMYSGKTPSYMECLLNPVNKGKYKRNVFVSYMFSIFSFCIILLWFSLGKALRRSVNVTALPLAPDQPNLRPYKFAYPLWTLVVNWLLPSVFLFKFTTQTTVPNPYFFLLLLLLIFSYQKKRFLILLPNFEFLASVCLHFSIFRTLGNRHFINHNTLITSPMYCARKCPEVSTTFAIVYFNSVQGWLELVQESWRPEETCCHSDYSEIPPANASVKNSNNNLGLLVINNNNKKRELAKLSTLLYRPTTK